MRYQVIRKDDNKIVATFDSWEEAYTYRQQKNKSAGKNQFRIKDTVLQK